MEISMVKLLESSRNRIFSSKTPCRPLSNCGSLSVIPDLLNHQTWVHCDARKPSLCICDRYGSELGDRTAVCITNIWRKQPLIHWKTHCLCSCSIGSQWIPREDSSSWVMKCLGARKYVRSIREVFSVQNPASSKNTAIHPRDIHRVWFQQKIILSKFIRYWESRHTSRRFQHPVYEAVGCKKA